MLAARCLLEEVPSFIRIELEAKLADIFASVGFNGPKIEATSKTILEALVSQGTCGEPWAELVVQALAGVSTEKAAPAVTHQEGQRPGIEIQVIVPSGLEIAVRLDRSVCSRRLWSQFSDLFISQIRCSAFQFSMQFNKQRPPMHGTTYKFLKGDTLLKDSDFLQQGDMITAVLVHDAIPEGPTHGNAETIGLHHYVGCSGFRFR